jgi:hypothetical protein
MRKYLLGLFCLFAFSACTEDLKTVESIYPLKLKELILQEKSSLSDDQKFEKVLWVRGRQEKISITKEQYAEFLESLSTYDINKVAYKNAFSTSNTNGREAYILGEEKLPIKKVYVDENAGKQSIFIYYDNTNNLFSSRHVIRWKMKQEISIYRITKIWGLDADSSLIQIRRK